MTTQKFWGGLAAFALAMSLSADTLSSVSIVYDVTDMSAMPAPGGFSFDPEEQGWTGSGLSGTATGVDSFGRVTGANFGAIFDGGAVPVAWQVYDAFASRVASLPTYERALEPSDYQAFYDEGWVFEFTVRTGATEEIIAAGSQDIVRGGFVGWTVLEEDDPGWGLDKNSAARVGFWVGNDSVLLPDGTRTQKFWIEDPLGNRFVLDAGSADEFQTIRCVGSPESSVYEWFLDGESMGSIDFLDVDLNSGSVIRFGAGSSDLIGGAVDWRRVELSSCPPPAPPAVGQAAILGEVTVMDDELMFTFESTYPAGTSFQPQYSAKRSRRQWVDIPDATVEFVEELDEKMVYEVMAPQFGDPKGFYRVISSTEADGDAPIADTLDAPPPESGEQLLIFAPQIMDSGEAPVASTIEAQVLDYIDEGPQQGLSNRLSAAFEESSEAGQHMRDFIVADLDGSGQPRPIFCWPDENGELQIIIRSVPQSGGSWPDEMIVFNIAGSLATEADLLSDSGQIRLATAQLDDDPEPELVVAWTDRDEQVHLISVDYNGDYKSEPTLSAEESSTSVASTDNFDTGYSFDLVTGNFDGDSTNGDEVAVVALTDGVDPQPRRVVARLYEATTTGFTLMTDADGGEVTLFDESLTLTNSNLPSVRRLLERGLVAATSVDVDCDGRDELAIVFSSNDFFSSHDLGQYVAIRLLRIAQDGESVTLGAIRQNVTSRTLGFRYIGVHAVNLDEDSGDELFFAGHLGAFYDLNADLSISSLGFARDTVLSGVNTQRGLRDPRSVGLIELDIAVPAATVPESPQVVITQDEGSSSTVDDARDLSVTVYAIVRDGVELDLEEISTKTIQVGSRSSDAVSAGVMAAPFSPLNVKLGVPRRYTRIVANQPTVILNAPPIHYDIIDGVEYDVNDIFPTSSSSSDFFSTYTISDMKP